MNRVSTTSPELWTIMHNGKSVTADTLTAAVIASRELRTNAEAVLAAQRLFAAIESDAKAEDIEIDNLKRRINELESYLEDYSQDATRWREFRDKHAEYDFAKLGNDHKKIRCYASFAWVVPNDPSAYPVGPEKLDAAIDNVMAIWQSANEQLKEPNADT